MVQVKIRDGILAGEVIEDEFAGKYYSFKGIPYAEPPVGELRFKEPKPVQPWEGVKNATQFGPPCFQKDIFINMTNEIVGSEDCLYLNVYTPEIKPKKPLPVMVWIHGGGFFSGCGDDALYGPQFLISHEVILVTFNYRLEVLGFLCLDSEDVPGNAGMKDQVAALRWIQKNISNFGGDPQNVTIFGESAGGASVSFHLLSPMSKGFFKRAIQQSGQVTCWWAYSQEPRETAIALAKKLGFYSEDSKELYEFFKNQPLENLVGVQLPITLAQLGRPGVIPFSIVDEKDFGNNERFFYGDPYDVLRNGIHEGVDVINGYNEDEGIFWLEMCPELDTILDLINRFTEYLIPEPIAENCATKQQFEVGRLMKKHYFGNDKVSAENIEGLIKFMSQNMFQYGATQWAKIVSKNSKNNKVFFYKFGCKTERKLIPSSEKVKKYFGDKKVTSHADDLAYLFSQKSSGSRLGKGTETYRLIENVTKLWTNFAKHGNPTPDESLGAQWTSYDLENRKYFDISNQFQEKSDPNADEIQFWEDVFKKYYPRYVN